MQSEVERLRTAGQRYKKALQEQQERILTVENRNAKLLLLLQSPQLRIAHGIVRRSLGDSCQF